MYSFCDGSVGTFGCGTGLIGLDRARHGRIRIPDACAGDYGVYLDVENLRGGLGVADEWFPLAEIRNLVATACNAWNDALKVRLRLTEDFEAAKVYMRFVSLRGNILGWASMADGSCVDDKQVRLDLRRWPSKRLLVETIKHEIGHILGLGHLGPNSLMSPTIKPRIEGPVAEDIDEAVRLGYEERTGPLPDPPKDKDRLLNRMDRMWEILIDSMTEMMEDIQALE